MFAKFIKLFFENIEARDFDFKKKKEKKASKCDIKQ